MTYPRPDDWSEFAIAKLPAVPARDVLGPAFAAGVQPMQAIDEDYGRLFDGMSDVEDAGGAVLDIMGDDVGEPRSGLSDWEYRRVVAGRRVASARNGAGTPARIWAGWIALTGAAADQADYQELPPASVLLTARLSWLPTTMYLARAGRVAADLMAAGYEVNAIAYVSGSATYGNTPGYGIGTYAATLRT